MIGQRIGSYDVVEELGRSSMGVVYRAHDPRLGRDVALEVMAPDPTADPRRRDRPRRERFLREARAVSSVAHPGIVTLFDLLEHEGTDVLVLELVRGRSLRRRIDEGALPWHEAAALGLELAEAMAAAHGQGVVHRDLRPENVMIGRRGRVKVLRLGLASLALPGHPAVSDHGHPAEPVLASYSAPELALAEGADPRCDLYSFGVVLYEMLAGRRPLRNESSRGASLVAPMAPPARDASRERDACRQKDDGDPPEPRPAALDQLVRDCLAERPDARPESFRAVAERLRPWVERPGGSTAIHLARTRLAAGPDPPPGPRSATEGGPDAGADTILDGTSLVTEPSPFDSVTLALESREPHGEGRHTGTAPTRSVPTRSVPTRSVPTRNVPTENVPTEHVPTENVPTENVPTAARKIETASYATFATGRRRGLWAGLLATLALAAAGLGWWLGDRPSSRSVVDGAASRPIVPPADSGAEQTPLDASFAATASAYDLYRAARDRLARHDRPGNIDQALELLDRSLALEPESAAAHAAVAEAYCHRSASENADPIFLERAESHARRALELDSHLALSHLAMARVAILRGRVERALAALEQAEMLDPLEAEIALLRGRALAADPRLGAAEAADRRPPGGAPGGTDPGRR